MAKMKTHKGASKRFKKTASGKLKRSRHGFAHKLTKRSSSRKRRGAQSTLVSEAETRNIKRLLPYA